jgi:uncharacterized membrane protein YdjX (TVP38/TMEM64 family)/Fe-S oxidoreductase
MGSSVKIAVPENNVAAGAIEKCVGCNICVKECSFLQRTGNPGDLAAGAQEYDPFECTLCGLCAAVCPFDVDPAKYFLERRREIHRKRGADDRRHSPLISYEKKGTSPLFTFYGLPEGCDVVFFPGCALPGTRPKAVEAVFGELRKQIPNLGIVLDCCLKPSHDLGREDHFHSSFGEIRDYLKSRGIRKVLVACPNCNRIFSDYGEGLAVQTVYELLPDLPGSVPELTATEVVFHDPCVARRNTAALDAARSMVKRSGVRVAEMKHAREKTLCCGRGGGVNFIRPEVIDESVASRVAEAEGRPIVTYCAACAGTFQQKATALHLLDLWMSPKEALAGEVKVSVAPMTYLNRLVLKRKFRNSGEFSIMRDRGGKDLAAKGNSKLKAAAAVAIVLALAVVARYTGATRLLDPENLRQLVQGHELLGPLLFILLYSLTPVLFLPGLPMALAAGILFGPVWGVVYAITGATIGASLSFLVARHLARGWVEAKLTGDMWKNLDQKVGEQGWKIVAVTRLVPLFPFNLLNYAFGITRIPFLHYVITSFFCMLPACIAFITFSSSLPQLLKGKVSPSLVIGLVCIGIVMMIPKIYRKRAQN